MRTSRRRRRGVRRASCRRSAPTSERVPGMGHLLERNRAPLARLLSCGVTLAGCTAAQSNRDWPIGSWSGTATFRSAELAFAVRFFRDGDSLRATFSSPDLLLLDLPLDDVRQDGGQIRFVTPDDHPLGFA